MYGSESPSTGQFPAQLHSQRRRARESHPEPQSGELEIEQAPPLQEYYSGVMRTLREKTSSIWSPHLRTDRRTSRYSVWEPPSVSWSEDSGILGKRNAQVVLFIMGFILPFAWMIAAFLPLPPRPTLEALEKENANQNSRLREIRRRNFRVDETRFESARWWRNLNRGMSVVGLVIIGAIIALVIVGVQQGWVVNKR